MTAELSQFARRHRVALSAVIALIVAVLALYRPTLVPPGFEARSVQVGTAATELMVAPTDMSIGTGSVYVTAVDHAVLLGDVMTTPPVIGYAARQLGIRPSQIQATAPMTANVPRVVSDPGSGEAAYNLVRSNAPFKLEVQADPSIPILHLYTQAPTTALAIRLAAAATSGLKRYAASNLPSTPGTATTIQVLGPIDGAVANSGARLEIGLLVFLGTFAGLLWVSVLATRIRDAWQRPDSREAARSARG